jgi:hypothetical protein
MYFNAITKTLTVSPGTYDYGSYTLIISYSTFYDGLVPGIKVSTHVFTIYRL